MTICPINVWHSVYICIWLWHSVYLILPNERLWKNERVLEKNNFLNLALAFCLFNYAIERLWKKERALEKNNDDN